MKDRTRSKWDFGRFIQTLNYFEIIPFIGRLPKWMSSNQTVQAVKDRSMGVILVSGSSLKKKEIIEQLRVKNPSVQVVDFKENDRSLQLKPIIALICCFDGMGEKEIQELNPLIEMTRKQLQTGERLLFDFTQPNENLKEIWGAVDDVVMGGVSESNLRFVRERAVFSGNVSVANNGGFASVRTRNFEPPLDLSNYEGIELRVEGDGKRYKFITRCEGKWDGLSYCYSFDTIYNFPQTIQIPFRDLIPVFRAKTVKDAGEFDASRVYSMQLMQSKFEYDGALNPRFSPGIFGLEIETIKAYGAKKITSQLIVVTQDRSLEAIIQNSGLNYTVIRYSNDSSIGKISETCLQAIEKPELSGQTIEV